MEGGSGGAALFLGNLAPWGSGSSGLLSGAAGVGGGSSLIPGGRGNSKKGLGVSF